MLEPSNVWTEGARPNRNDIRKLDGAGPAQYSPSQQNLVMSLRVRRRTVGFRLQSDVGRVAIMRARRGLGWAEIWQVDRATPSRSAYKPRAILGLSLRMRAPACCLWWQSEERCFRFLWLHHRGGSQKAADQAWHVGQQAAYGVVLHDAALQKSQKPQFRKLRGTRDRSVRCVAGLFSVLARYGTDIQAGTDHRAHRRKRSLRASQLHLGASWRTGQKPPSIIRVEAK